MRKTDRVSFSELDMVLGMDPKVRTGWRWQGVGSGGSAGGPLRKGWGCSMLGPAGSTAGHS